MAVAVKQNVPQSTPSDDANNDPCEEVFDLVAGQWGRVVAPKARACNGAGGYAGFSYISPDRTFERIMELWGKFPARFLPDSGMRRSLK